MALSWNEIKDRALRFTKEWEGESRERAEKDSFWNDFFTVFGISRRRLATFEEPVKKLNKHQGFIDLFWKGTLLVEHKSKGKSLDGAFEQASDYFHGIKDHELPKYVLVSDFENFRLYDLEEKTEHNFNLAEFHKNIKLFGFIAGYQKRTFKDEDEVNIAAAELMGKLHDQLEDSGYTGHDLEAYLVRLLFCLFADDTGIFEKDTFKEFIELKTNEDGSNLGAMLAQFFQVLNTPREKRMSSLDEHLAAFPYVNGKLFEEFLMIPAFNSRMREILLLCSSLNWGKISPAIFGSMFQSVMDPKERRNLGAHYTSEKNIQKLIKPLFLDELWEEFHKIKGNKKQLKEFQVKLGKLKFLDPACGCGNFLIITYREIRLLELEVMKEIYKGQQAIGIQEILCVDVDQFYGIEFEEFPARIAEVAMWLIDHQMNLRISEEFGMYYARLPLKKSAKIFHGDALAIDWQSLLNPINSIDVIAKHANIYLVNEPAAEYKTVNVQSETVQFHYGGKPEENPEIKFDYILGNPPFIGAKVMSSLQREAVVREFDGSQGSGTVDYVTAWYIKSAKYIQDTKIKAAFVSTNSIVQGEQVSLLWGQMLNKYKIKIHFAHRTFKWSNEARGKAAVYCVIVGFASFDVSKKFIYDYDDVKGDPNEIIVKHINPYLLDAKDVFVTKRSTPICDVPKLSFGNMPLDGGNLFLNESEKETLIAKYPQATKYIKRVFGSEEFLHNKTRYCLWLENAQPNELRQIPEILERIEAVRKFRLASIAPSTQKFASTPGLFRDRRLPKTYVVVPKVSSEKRKYIPLGFFTDEYIATDLLFIIPDCSLYHFGVLSSMMHMVWTRNVCGRLKGDYRYSKDIVYNNFPWPVNPSQEKIAEIENSAKRILEVRSGYVSSSLADLYNIKTMPLDLIKAHKELDKAVDKAYRASSFPSESKRLEYLFDLLEDYLGKIFKS
ncbi:class I SAM-dependent DNA methyltransferase [Algoriphagus sp.]|uniref:class I SAM-dependent DNA methyltransferase n=1 Tax=Algoriphagus sp. TaxID=1872435 RepID=UPI0039188DB1